MADKIFFSVITKPFPNILFWFILFCKSGAQKWQKERKICDLAGIYASAKAKLCLLDIQITHSNHVKSVVLMSRK